MTLGSSVTWMRCPAAKCAAVTTQPPQAWPGLNFFQTDCALSCSFDGWPVALCEIAGPCCHKVALHNQKVAVENKGRSVLTSTAIAVFCGMNPCEKDQYYDEKLQICLRCTSSTCPKTCEPNSSGKRAEVLGSLPPCGDPSKKPPSQHKLSPKIKECMKGFEGFCKNCYLDKECKWTIGFGFLQPTKTACSKFEPMSLETAQATFEREITKHENDVKKNIKVDLTQGQYDAIVDMVYNMGISKFKKTDTFKFVNNNQLSQVPKRLRSVTGSEAPRRAYEADIFEGKLDYNKCPKYLGFKNKLCNITTCQKKSK
ncbi:hypothetical protein BGZ88_005897 [Linnemannia elongata]|nr:hypothetical protein BGZ88_005897 [Linnemannia elongata]